MQLIGEAVKAEQSEQRALAWRHYRQDRCHLNNFSLYFNLFFRLPRRRTSNRSKKTNL